MILHFAATVGVGQSMYENSRYMSLNTEGTAELLQAMLDTKLTPDKLIIASPMSIYGEEQYVCSCCRRTAFPPVRTVAQLKLAQWEVHCTMCGGELVPRPTNETKPPRSILSTHFRSGTKKNCA